MEERKLNFNAPLLSVRRISTAPASSNGGKAKRNVTISLQNSRRTRTAPLCKPEVCLDQVTEPVAVPFIWEQIPGKCKDPVGSELQPSEEGSVTPRLPPGRVLDIVKYPLEKEVIDQSVCRPQTEKCIQDDRENVGDETCGLELENDEEVYSDALDTLSPTDSISMNYSVSVLSGSDCALVKPSGIFSSDAQTRDFMMGRFLPAAKAMTLEPPQYASRKQPIAVEQPREVKKMVVQDNKPPQKQYESIIVPYYDPKTEEETEEETDDENEDDKYDVTRNISKKACGLLPRLCFKNTLCLLNPLPGLKVRTHSSKPSIREVRKPGKAASRESQSQILKQRSLDIHKRNSDSVAQSPKLPQIRNKPLYTSNRLTKSGELQITNRAQSPKLPEIRNKPLYSASRLTNSGELQITNRAQSPKLPVIRNTPLYTASRLTNSGELQITNRAQSPKLPVIRNTPLYTASRLTKSGELQITNTSSPSRLPVSGRISPYRRDRPQSPFKGGGLLGIPKEAENFRASMLNKYNWTSNKSYSHELVSHRSSKQGSGSASPAVEKTLYVDMVNLVEGSLNSSSADTTGWISSMVKDSETLSGMRGLKNTGTRQSSFEDLKCTNTSLKDRVILEPRTSGPIEANHSSPSHFPNVRCQSEKESYVLDEEFNQESKFLEHLEAKNEDIDSYDGSKADDQGDIKADYEPTPLPPPLPKMPSESWLWRTLSTVTSRSSFTQSHFDTQHGTKKQEPKTPATSTKWETIVKTSHLHHDHVRYSEELTAHVSQHRKN